MYHYCSQKTSEYHVYPPVIKHGLPENLHKLFDFTSYKPPFFSGCSTAMFIYHIIGNYNLMNYGLYYIYIYIELVNYNLVTIIWLVHCLSWRTLVNYLDVHAT